MNKFTDALSRDWTLKLTIGIAKQLKDKLPIDLLQVDRSIPELYVNPVYLAEVLWYLVEDEATKKGISQEQFFEGLLGDALDAGREALLQAIKDFFPSRQRKTMDLMLGAVEKAMSKMDEMAKVVETKIDEELDKIAGQSFSELQEQSQ